MHLSGQGACTWAPSPWRWSWRAASAHLQTGLSFLRFRGLGYLPLGCAGIGAFAQLSNPQPDDVACYCCKHARSEVTLQLHLSALHLAPRVHRKRALTNSACQGTCETFPFALRSPVLKDLRTVPRTTVLTSWGRAAGVGRPPWTHGLVFPW